MGILLVGILMGICGTYISVGKIINIMKHWKWSKAWIATNITDEGFGLHAIKTDQTTFDQTILLF
jgi:hypothetical protein